MGKMRSLLPPSQRCLEIQKYERLCLETAEKLKGEGKKISKYALYENFPVKISRQKLQRVFKLRPDLATKCGIEERKHKDICDFGLYEWSKDLTAKELIAKEKEKYRRAITAVLLEHRYLTKERIAKELDIPRWHVCSFLYEYPHVLCGYTLKG